MGDELKEQGLAEAVGQALSARGWMLATAESCTGGWVAQVVTSVSGSSQWYERGFVTYSNRAKEDMLSVDPEVLARAGAVSEAAARAMAEGALAYSPADVALAVTGVAGPGGGTAEKPVGMVCFAWAGRGRATRVATRRFSGGRREVRRESVRQALEGLLDYLKNA